MKEEGAQDAEALIKNKLGISKNEKKAKID